MDLNNINSYIATKLSELFDLKDNIQLLWRVHTKDLVYVVANRNGLKEIYWFDQETDFSADLIIVKTFKYGDGRDTLNWLIGDLTINRSTHGDTCKVTEIYAYNNCSIIHQGISEVDETLIFSEKDALEEKEEAVTSN